jgi:hypothetical protein
LLERLETPASHAARLPIWTAKVDPQPLAGGITNTNFLVDHAGRRYVVRIGGDIDVHGVLRRNELAASRAAHAAGIAPEVVHAEPGALVLAFVDGRTLGPDDIRGPGHPAPDRRRRAALPSRGAEALARSRVHVLAVPCRARLRAQAAREKRERGSRPRP